MDGMQKQILSLGGALDAAAAGGTPAWMRRLEIGRAHV